GTLKFEPQLGALPDFMEDGPTASKFLRNLKFNVIGAHLKIYDYASARQLMLSRTREFPVYPCVFVGWDNTPRRGGNGIIVINSTPARFESALRDTVRSVLDRPDEDRLVFVN